MRCTFHPDREAIGACTNCGRPLCDECKEVVDGRFYCSSCAPGVVAEIVLEPAESSNLGWFGRHLN
jgi:hypothetical protein